MLKIKNLWVEREGKEILKGVDLEIKKNEKHVLFGPNGSGKSTLAFSLIGLPFYKIKRGGIFFNGKNLAKLKINERAKLIGMAFQSPPEIRGVKLGEIIKIHKKKPEEILEKAFLSEEFSNRDLNFGFSGGEKKRSELAQLFAMDQKFIILDEIDSGVDLESLNLIGKELKDFLKDKSALIITHYGYILKYLKPDKTHVMINGRIVCSGNYKKIWSQIEKGGYKWCEKCPKVME